MGSIKINLKNKSRKNVLFNLDVKKVLNKFFIGLKKRERDIIKRRYSLKNGAKETLESIGSSYKLTRERVRQIENNAIRKMLARQKLELSKEVREIEKLINQLLELYNGVMESDFLLDSLLFYSGNFNNSKQLENEHKIKKEFLNFILNFFLPDKFEILDSNKLIKKSVKIKDKDINFYLESLSCFIDNLSKINKPLTTKELIDLFSIQDFYRKNKQMFNSEESEFNIFEDFYPVSYLIKLQEDEEQLIKQNKFIFSLFRMSNDIKQSNFNNKWGIKYWTTITPKTINDKVYLILENLGEPMHFTRITDEINKAMFDNKIANSATVHNELLADDRFILVRRGVYGLKEWF